MSAVPEVKVFNLSAKDMFLLCGCDGFWSCFSPEDAVHAVAAMLETGKPVKAICDRLICMVMSGRDLACAIGKGHSLLSSAATKLSSLLAGHPRKAVQGQLQHTYNRIRAKDWNCTCVVAFVVYCMD